MKQVGYGNNGAVIVEFDPGEWTALKLLTQKTQDYNILSSGWYFEHDIPTEGAFAAITDWIDFDHRAHELRQLADKLDAWLQKKDEPDEANDH